MTPSPAESFLPLPPIWFGALLAMSDGPKHGYAVIKEMEDRAVASKRPAAGTVYIALRRLVDKGLIEELDPPSDADGRGKRMYGLTGLGRSVTALEAARMRELVDISAAKKLLDPA
ncbi:MAG: PadR family transcriptional regulator [Gemmatimonadota bacterium]